MTAKSRQFPLPLSSLDEKSSNRTNKLINSALMVETPQTATQNVRKNAAKENETAAAKPQNVLFSLKTTRGLDHVARLSENKVESHKKMASGAFDLEAPRKAMIARLIKQGVTDDVVLHAMSMVPRHRFIESGLIGQAYIDAPLPIGYQQTISQPYIVARMIEIMRHGRALHHVLEIGTGCGYQAAVLAQLSENVYSIERIKLLHELAKNNLRSLRIANLRLHYGDGMLGMPQAAPFDGIILAAAGMRIPEALLQQLAIGGRLIAPVGGKQQVLQLIERTGKEDWVQSALEGCYFVPLCPGTI